MSGGWDQFRFVMRTKHDKELKRRERKQAKAARAAFRRAMKDNTSGKISDVDPMAAGQPPMPAGVARSLGVI
jgi:hypothetical protein